MNGAGFTLFETALGVSALGWTESGLSRVLVPEPDEETARAHLGRVMPDVAEATPSPEMAAVRDGIVALLAGEPVDFAGTRLDLGDADDFARAVYGVASGIRPGSTLTYGEIARRLGEPRAAREVGQALGRNPVPIVVPCHRVLAAGGRTGGFSARGGVATKLRILSIEARHAPEPGLFGGALPMQARPAGQPLVSSTTRR